MFATDAGPLAVATDVLKPAEPSFAKTIPSELARTTAMLRPFARLELTNGGVISGHICEMDPFTMNIKLDSVVQTSVQRRFDPNHTIDASRKDEPNRKKTKNEATGEIPSSIEDSPIAFRCVSQVVVRGSCVRYLDFPSPETSSNTGHCFETILDICNAVRPSA
ncbi:unnamed protein product [Phytomonas sp. Hart1]|nr:unnamed protein product [Phytomonas sp. Hart1]|eukprot:CCW71767.1 unnamed protein product [Phytomonas sp. isolate Hart1]